MPVLRVVAAVIRDGKRVLACRRKPEKSEPGRWEFPGGKVEAGESDAAALIREIQEELGVQIAVGEHLSTTDTPRGDIVIRLAVYTVSLLSNRPTTSSDHDRMMWVTSVELSDLNWAPADLPAVSLLSQHSE